IPWHTRESAYPLQEDTEHAMPPFLCRPIAPEIRPNTTFWHGGADAADGAPSARQCASLDGVRIVLHAWSAPSRKSDVGLIPIKLGAASGQRGDASFFGAPSFFCANLSASWSAVCRHDILTA